jgi:hypothetical protein
MLNGELGGGAALLWGLGLGCGHEARVRVKFMSRVNAEGTMY